MRTPSAYDPMFADRFFRDLAEDETPFKVKPAISPISKAYIHTAAQAKSNRFISSFFLFPNMYTKRKSNETLSLERARSRMVFQFCPYFTTIYVYLCGAHGAISRDDSLFISLCVLAALAALFIFHQKFSEFTFAFSFT